MVCKCYLCHHYEDLEQCENCGDNFLSEEFVDFSDSFQADYSEGRYEVFNNYGYDYHKACASCASEIKQRISDLESEYHYEQMMEEEYYERHQAEKAAQQ